VLAAVLTDGAKTGFLMTGERGGAVEVGSSLGGGARVGIRDYQSSTIEAYYEGFRTEVSPSRPFVAVLMVPGGELSAQSLVLRANTNEVRLRSIRGRGSAAVLLEDASNSTALYAGGGGAARLTASVGSTPGFVGGIGDCRACSASLSDGNSPRAERRGGGYWPFGGPRPLEMTWSGAVLEPTARNVVAAWAPIGHRWSEFPLGP